MSNGYFRLARIDTAKGVLCIDECWGNLAHEDRAYRVSIVGENTKLAGELLFSRDQVQALAAQLAEYFAAPIGLVTAGGGDVDPDDLPF